MVKKRKNQIEPFPADAFGESRSPLQKLNDLYAKAGWPGSRATGLPTKESAAQRVFKAKKKRKSSRG